VTERTPSRLADVLFTLALVAAAGVALWWVVDYARASLAWADLGEAALSGLWTLLRVVVLMVIATAIWVPIGVWLGLRPAMARRAQPVAQFLAAFPANLLFPVFVIAIVRFRLNVDVWLSPLMLLGAQWYILFNVVAGAAAFPGDLKEAARNLRVGGWLWWRRVMLPGIFPYYVTGAITASGGAWNASIVAEVASWGNTKLAAHGLGAYIAAASEAGQTPRVVLGVAVMSLFVVAFNRVVWRPMYAFANRRLTFG
jgi:NitT/TauT family transport system permease protein